jgi:glycosyltransferase involved in cell wall biosynthesis
MDEPRVDVLLAAAIEEFRPDVAHIQELVALPTSVIDVLHNAGVPAVMTLQDYYPLCPTLKLFDHDGAICLKPVVGEDCAICCRGADQASSGAVRSSLHYDMSSIQDRLPWGLGRLLKGPGKALWRLLSAASSVRTISSTHPSPALYQRRREVNLARLNRVEILVPMSRRVEEIYRALGIRQERLKTLQLTLEHIAGLRVRQYPSQLPAVTFGTMNGLISVPKGARLLAGALRRLEGLGYSGRYRLVAWGGIDGSLRDELLARPEVRFESWYKPHMVDAMLDEVDVGIVPSIWEEAYGYVGPEFLAKGIPVLGTARGGIVDYTRDGETGWVVGDVSPEGLAAAMARLIDDPAAVLAMHQRVVARRASLIKPMPVHVDEMTAIYREAIEKRASAGAPA